MRWWWISFAGDDPPQGPGFLGAVLVSASSFIEAVTVACVLGINPGGQALGIEAPEGFAVPVKWQERLLTREECARYDAELLGEVE